MNERAEQKTEAAAAEPVQTGTMSAPTTPEEEIAGLRAAIEEAEAQAAEMSDKNLRANAEMQNFKKPVERNYADQARATHKSLLNRMLVVKDNLERALQYGTSKDASGESIIEGVRLTQY